MKNKKISIFSSITILFSVLFSVGVITLVTYSFMKSEYAIEKLAKRLNGSIADQVKQEFELLVEPSNNFINVIETFARVDGKLTLKSRRLQQVLLNYVETYPQLYNVFIALPDKSFLMATDSDPLKMVLIESKKNISTLDLIKLTNLIENYSISELVDNCLAKNKKKTMYILNENKFSSEDCITIIRTFIYKLKRILILSNDYLINKNLDKTILSAKPPIFWKDKDIVKQQINKWSPKQIKNLIYYINEIELSIKKNFNNSINLTTNIIIDQVSSKTN